MLRYVISYKTKFGTISAESKKPQDLVGALSDLKMLAAKIQSKNSKPKKIPSKVQPREGKGETTEILRGIESRLLTTNFFSKPKTTGETRDRLAEVARRRFTSRKVSQALGILRDKGVLHRTGRRNFYAYTTA
ncbi:MAG TPA: hypothetical protein VNE86_04040 [Nitrososphaerales archaeon]|nr:hypothetical protein [Nitrososphaerales archaeon]